MCGFLDFLYGTFIPRPSRKHTGSSEAWALQSETSEMKKKDEIKRREKEDKESSDEDPEEDQSECKSRQCEALAYTDIDETD